MPKITSNEGKPYEEIGTLLRNLRLRRGLSQFDLASSSGINNSYLSRIENGERRPSPKILKKFSEILNYPYDELVVTSGILTEDFIRSTASAAKPEPAAGSTTEALQSLINAVQHSGGLGRAPSPSGERVPVPVFDNVPAGLLQEANVIEAHADVAQVLLPEDDTNRDPRAFSLIVQGDSMVEAGILDGDLLVVSPNTPLAQGDIGVVLVNKRTTSVKKIFRHDRQLVLQPANSNYPPQVLSHPDEVEVLGKVILVRRKIT